MNEQLQIPRTLWEHPLFAASAAFKMENPWFTASRMDYQIRKIKRMPSCADQSNNAALAGVDHIMQLGRQWISRSPHPISSQCRHYLKRADQLASSLSGESLSEALKIKMVTRISGEIMAFTQVHALANQDPGAAPEARLDEAILCLLDFTLHADPLLHPRYHKHLYRAIDNSLTFNATSDEHRNLNVLNWLRALLLTEPPRHLAYVDVGCSVLTGALNTLLASRILRPDAVCDVIHGTDIVPPPTGLASRMLNQHRIQLYLSDPVTRPLPRRYDAILLANVHRHLDHELQTKLLANLGESLNDQGLLMINWRFDDQNSPCVCLQRTGRELVIKAEKNVAMA